VTGIYIFNHLPQTYYTVTYNGTEIYLQERGGARGPVVLFFNGGYGSASAAKKMLFEQAGHFSSITTASFKYRQSGFGGDELIDAVNAVEYFQNRGRAVYLIGKSHGGYLALMTATRTNCSGVVSLAGPTSLMEMEEFSLQNLYLPLSFSPLIKMTANECGGLPSEVPGCYQDRSPAYLVEKITAPVILVHSRSDAIVPFSQSELMADALNRSGKVYQFYEVMASHLTIEYRDETWGHVCEFFESLNLPCQI